MQNKGKLDASIYIILFPTFQILIKIFLFWFSTKKLEWNRIIGNSSITRDLIIHFFPHKLMDMIRFCEIANYDVMK